MNERIVIHLLVVALYIDVIQIPQQVMGTTDIYLFIFLIGGFIFSFIPVPYGLRFVRLRSLGIGTRCLNYFSDPRSLSHICLRGLPVRRSLLRSPYRYVKRPLLHRLPSVRAMQRAALAPGQHKVS